MSVDLSFLTRWLESRRLAFANVRLWHLADMQPALSMSAIGGKADMTLTCRYVR